MLKVTEFNAETGKTIIREMTPNELANYETEKAKFFELLLLEKAELAQKAAAKAAAEAKLEALGLTADDLKALGL
jgi:hypothetical protein